MAITFNGLGLGADVHPDTAVADSASRAPVTGPVDQSAAPERGPPAPIPPKMLADARAVSPNNPAGYGVFRPRQGPHGTWHWGLDIPFDPVTHGAVAAPEHMVITHVWTDDRTPPFVGYGPAGVVGQGASGVFHLLGHLDIEGFAVTVGQTFEAGELVAMDSKLVGHVHWEVRTKAVDEGPATRAAFTINPVLWMGAQSVMLSKAPGLPWWVWALGLYAVSRMR